MKIVNAKVFVDGKFTDGGIEFDETIKSVGPEVNGAGDIDAGGAYIIPGLVDIHAHSAVNEDSSDGSLEGLAKMSRYYASNGVTSWCPTTMTFSEEILTNALHAARDFSRPADGARIAGINLEGPFISYEKRGAQNPAYIMDPDADMFDRLNEASGGIVRIITIAPETEGAIEFTKRVSKTAVVSIGHTTADYDTAMAAYDAGASHTTHLFNAMPPLHHRDPGVIAAAFDSGSTIEMIVDGFHSHPAVVRLTHQLFGERMVLISDSTRCTGMPDGEYELGGQPTTMKDGKAYIKGTNTIAGSTINLMDGLLRSHKFGLTLEESVKAATIIPAKVIGQDKYIGSLEAGKYADLVIMTPELDIKNVYINGKAR